MIDMPEGWKTVSIPQEVYDKAKKYYDKHEEELKLQYGVHSFSGFLNFCIRFCMKEKGIIKNFST